MSAPAEDHATELARWAAEQVAKMPPLTAEDRRELGVLLNMLRRDRRTPPTQ